MYDKVTFHPLFLLTIRSVITRGRSILYNSIFAYLQLIHLGEDFNAEFDGQTARLSINQVYPEDEGEYTCVAYNELGKAITSSCLIVDSE